MTDPLLAHKTENGRYYSHPYKISEVPSITNVKDTLAIPALKYYFTGECATYVSENVAKLATLDADEIYRLVKDSPYRKDSKKASSSLTGDIVHDWIDQVIKGRAVSDVDTSFYIDRKDDDKSKKPPVQALWTWNAFKKFLDTYKPEWEMGEFTVWSETHGYAGTMDWSARVGSKKIFTLGDNKTGNHVYPDMALQLAAGQFADYILLPDTGTASGWKQVEIPRYDDYRILHLRPRSFQLVPMYHIEEAFQAFLGLKAAFDWKVALQDETVGTAYKYPVRAEDFK